MTSAHRRQLLLVSALTVALAAAPSAQADRFSGTWVSENGEFLNVTTMQPDGRFRTERFQGLALIGTVEGRWQVRRDTIVWTYLVPPGDAEDVNPVVSAAKDRFTLRETDGSTSTFFRKGVVDPLSPDVLPVAVGTGWVLQDDEGEVGIRIGVRQTVAGQDCYKVDWIDPMMGGVYQSEFWALREDGLYAVGRTVLGREMLFAEPYRLLSRTPAAGEKWQASVKAAAMSESLSISVAAEREVTTPAGKFRATPVTIHADATSYRRWYARGVGLVKEESFVLAGVREDRLNSKLLKRRIE